MVVGKSKNESYFDFKSNMDRAVGGQLAKKYLYFLILVGALSCSSEPKPVVSNDHDSRLDFALVEGDIELPPIIDDFNPKNGNVGTSVTLHGQFQGIDSVAFNGVEALSFSVSGDHKTINAVAPDELGTGKIVVKNSLGAATTQTSFEYWCDPILRSDQSLVITDLSVVEDPERTVYLNQHPNRAVWSFSYLMQQMTPHSMSTDQFIRNWLKQWAQVTRVNGFSIVPRKLINEIISNWPKKNGELNLEKAPFRLLAITNRIDLRNRDTAGEARFIFEVLDKLQGPMSFSVILEYKMPLENGETLKSWNRSWHDLSLEKFPSDEYNVKLAEVTQKFSAKNFVGIFKNGSAISQVRSNEIALSENGDPWELREFHLNGKGDLEQGTVAQTPDFSLNRTDRLDHFMSNNQFKILNGSYNVPEDMLGGASPAESNTKWRNKDSAVHEDVRHEFSLGTCNGCHSGETHTNFTHFSFRNAGEESFPSNFLKNDRNRRFDDMKMLITKQFCTDAVIDGDSSDKLSSEDRITWVSLPDKSPSCSNFDAIDMDFSAGEKLLSAKNIHVFGHQKNRDVEFWKGNHSCNDTGAYLQCYQISTAKVAQALELGFKNDPRCEQSGYTRVH